MDFQTRVTERLSEFGRVFCVSVVDYVPHGDSGRD